MKRSLLAGAASVLLIAGSPALAADMPLKVPRALPVFTWTSCYAGVHGGGGWARKDITDPVQLVQDSISDDSVTTGVTTARLSPSGYLIGGQFGCDYQPVGARWVIGFEGSFSGGSLTGDKSLGLPLGDPGDLARVSARLDFISSGTARIGWASDRWLLYFKGGIAGASDKYKVIGTFQGNPFDFEGEDIRIGWTAGGGVEWALFDNWSAKLEYDYYGFGTRSVQLTDNNTQLSGPVQVKQSVQAVKLGLNFHIWSFDR
jgi:opacity protein-like surface antigen